MIKRIIKYCFLMLLPCILHGQTPDTANVMNRLVNDLKSIRDVSYNYTMDVFFPNGDKDHMNGTIYLSVSDHIYYNDCSAFTMIYSSQWFYKADHQNKTLSIVELDKEANGKKLKKAREKEIFQNELLNTFLDSVLLKKATLIKYEQKGKITRITLKFSNNASTVKGMDFEYNTESNLLVSCEMLSLQPWLRTPKGIQSIELKIKFYDFKKIGDKGIYSIDNFFAYRDKKLELKKYNNYKLSTKI